MSQLQSRVRRALVSLFSLLLACVLFRMQIAAALVVRGDDFLTANRLEKAREHYLRALWFDPDSSSAADRYIFSSMEQRTPKAMNDGLTLANAFLLRHSASAVVVEDRALCYLVSKRYALALADFERAAVLTANSQTYVFAGWVARRARKMTLARTLWHTALRLQPKNRAARLALAEEKQ